MRLECYLGEPIPSPSGSGGTAGCGLRRGNHQESDSDCEGAVLY